MSHLVSYKQIEGNLRRTASNGLISLLNQKQYEDGIITEKDMTLEDIEAINKIYKQQIKDLRETLSKKLSQKR